MSGGVSVTWSVLLIGIIAFMAAVIAIIFVLSSRNRKDAQRGFEVMQDQQGHQQGANEKQS